MFSCWARNASVSPFPTNRGCICILNDGYDRLLEQGPYGLCFHPISHTSEITQKAARTQQLHVNDCCCFNAYNYNKTKFFWFVVTSKQQADQLLPRGELKMGISRWPRKRKWNDPHEVRKLVCYDQLVPLFLIRSHHKNIQFKEQQGIFFLPFWRIRVNYGFRKFLVRNQFVFRQCKL